jgi:hypothetical protein
VIDGLRELVAQLPDEAVAFDGTEFPFPVSQALFGTGPDPRALREELPRLDESEAEPQEAAWAVLAAAEAIESVQADRDEFFITDGRFRGSVFTGIKWRAGWVLLLGEGQRGYAAAFREASFMVFTTQHGLDEGRFLGRRETASVYFAQLLARYVLLYSDVKAGERHELRHLVEDHGPGVLVVCGKMRPIEALLCLALMRLGVGAIVASAEFPWEVGNLVLVSSPEEAVQATAGFQNLRMRSQTDPLAALPEYANPAYAREEFEPVARLGGMSDSRLFMARAEMSELAADTVKTIPSTSQSGEDASIAIRVAISDPTLDAPARAELEHAAIGYLNLLKGLRVEDRDPLTLLLAEEGRPNLDQIGEVLRRALRLEYPRVGPIEVTVATDPATTAELARQAERERARRPGETQAMAEEEVVYSCESCAPFSREHVCFVHPLRAPMCGRSWSEMVVGARYMGVSAGQPWRRRGRPENCCAVVPLRKALDPVKGEYEGLNASSCARRRRDVCGACSSIRSATTHTAPVGASEP